MREQNVGPITGLAWYRREQWPSLREKAADPEDLEETYEEWLKIAANYELDGEAARRLRSTSVHGFATLPAVLG